jgi:RNA polymerase sigma-70 factor (ECF subfamily)
MMKKVLAKSEEELIKKSQQNDKIAFEQIVLLYEKRVFNYCRRYLNVEEDSEDVTQEIFLKVFKKIRSYDFKSGSFSTWLFTIARNTTYDWLRKKRRIKEIKLDDLPINFETKLDSGIYKYNSDAIHRKIDLKLALVKIRPDYQKAIRLFYWSGLGYKEIAKIMKIPLNTVKTYISRAKKSLSIYFKKGDH